MVTCYRIKDWDDNFENGESRKYKRLTWVATPNKHSGKGWGRMVAHKRKVDLFCGWNLIIQIASKCPERGLLVDDNRPLTADDMAVSTQFPESIFTLCLDFFSSKKVGWLEILDFESKTPISEDLRKSPEVSGETSATEQGKQGIQGEKEGQSPETSTASPCSPSNIPNLQERQAEFKAKVKAFSDQYPIDMLKGFYEYWTEPTHSGKKMRFETEKTWDLGRRLSKWARNDEEWHPKKEPVGPNLNEHARMQREAESGTPA